MISDRIEEIDSIHQIKRELIKHHTRIMFSSEINLHLPKTIIHKGEFYSDGLNIKQKIEITKTSMDISIHKINTESFLKSIKTFYIDFMFDGVKSYETSKIFQLEITELEYNSLLYIIENKESNLFINYLLII